METFWTVVGIIIALGFVFCWGYITASVYEYPKIDSDTRDFYCFECEIEMPVKEEKGRFYCSNCGLYHGAKV